MNRSGHSNSTWYANRISACATVTALVMLGCDANRSSTESGSARAREPMLVNTLRLVEVQDSLKTEVGFGKLKPNRSARLSFVRPGMVKTVLKNSGDLCVEGEALAILDQQLLEQQQESLAANLARLKQNPQAAQQAAETTAQLKETEAQLATGTIKAPFDSVVVACNIKQGSQTSPAIAAFIVAENTIPFIETSLPKDVVLQLQPDQKLWAAIGGKAIVSKVKIQPDALGDATLRVKANRTLRLEFEEELPDDSWVFGDVVEIRFYVHTGQSGFWVPISALQQDNKGQWSVSVIVDLNQQRLLERRPVKVLQLEDEFALVVGNIVADDEVVADGGHRVVAGQQVKPIDKSKKFSPPFRKEIAD